jgi:iron complex outermembrane receptor protein
MTNKIFRIKIILFFILINNQSLQAQTTGEIAGRVIDAKTKEALPGANVVVTGTYRGSSTDRNGEFRIARMEAGRYTLRVSFIGYEPVQKKFILSAGSVAYVLFALTPGAIQMGEVVVIASKQEEEIEKTTTSVSLLTNESAMRRNALRLDAVLESIPGVNLMAENVNIRNSTGYTRGLGSRILMLLDGVPILMSDFGNMNWDLVPVTEIERVEVLKGPASAIYGSFALGGVMNILTKSPSPDGRFTIRATAGIYDKPYYDSWSWSDRTLNFNRTDVSYSRQIGAIGIKLSASKHESTGDRMNRHFRRWNASGKMIWTPGSTSELTLFSSFSSDRRGEFVWGRLDQPYLVDPEFEDFRVSQDALSFYLKYRQFFGKRFELKARASYIRQISGNQLKVDGDFKPAQGPGANIELTTQLHKTWNLTAGVEYKYDFAEQRHFGRHFGYTLSPYIHQVWNPGSRLRLTYGARYDFHYLLPSARVQEQFYKNEPIINPLPEGKKEGYISPQAGVSFELFDGSILHAAYGSGIRIPTIAERFTRFTVPLEFIGNARLETEKSRSFEIGLRQRIANLVKFEVTAFSNTYRNLIEPVYVADLSRFFATLVNIEKARIRGIEASANLSLWRNLFTLDVSTTWTEPMIQDTGAHEGIRLPFESGDYLSYRPRLIAYLTPTFNLGAFSVAADFAYTSKLKREQVQVFKDDKRIAKRQLDLRGAYRYKSLLLQIIIRNALHYNFTQIERNIGESRNYALAVQWEI